MYYRIIQVLVCYIFFVLHTAIVTIVLLRIFFLSLEIVSKKELEISFVAYRCLNSCEKNANLKCNLVIKCDCSMILTNIFCTMLHSAICAIWNFLDVFGQQCQYCSCFLVNVVPVNVTLVKSNLILLLWLLIFIDYN